MKYYRNLLKRKRYGQLIACLIVFLLGLSAFLIGILDVLNRGFNNSGLSFYTIYNNGTAGLLSATNIGFTLIGLFIMYVGLVWMPMNIPEAQDDSDYDIKSEGEFLHIRFKTNEFIVNKHTFEPTDLFFRDKNKRFVSMTRGYQIYNYIMAKYPGLTEREIDDSKIVLKAEVVDRFSNVKKMTVEEKRDFINYKNLKNKPRFFFVITSILLWLNFAFWLFGLLCLIITFDFVISYIIVSIIMIIISFILGKKSNIAISKNKKLIAKILNEDVYIVKCEIYDRKHESSTDTSDILSDDYYIKITDGNYVVDEWIETTKEIYERDSKNISIYIFDKTGKYYFLIF